jgi:membrane protein
MLRVQTLGKLILAAAKNWSRDNVPRLGASLAYYTLFSLAPMLIVAIAVAGIVFGGDAVRGQIVQQLDGLLGAEGAAAVQSLLVGASKKGASGIAVVVGGVTLLLGSSGAFMELQHALNTVFRVKIDPSKTGFAHFIKHRLRSFAMVVSIGFLLLVSLTINAALTAASSYFEGILHGGAWIWVVAELLVSFAIVTVLFAMIYRFVPDARLAWRNVWTGAFITAILFTIGKTAIGAYIGHSSLATGYGAVGSVLALLVWIYYSAQVVLFGAELTRQWTEYHEGTPEPDPFAERSADAHPSAEKARAKPAPHPHLKRSKKAWV